MAWLSRVNFTASDVLSYTDLNNLGNDIRAWGGNVNGGGYTLSNVVLSASSGTMATVIGGTGTTSTLTLRSTSGVGTTGADIIFQTGNNGATEVMRLQNGGNVGIGTSSPGAKLDVRSGTLRLSTDGSPTTIYGINRGDTSSVNGMASIGMFGSGTYGYLGNIIFSTAGSDVYNASVLERMRIDSSGNVGIGVSTANTRLHVDSDVSNTDGTGYDQGQLFVSDSSLSSSGLILGYRYQSGVAEYARIQARNAGGATNIVMQAGGGNVGIGTASPGHKLEIGGGGGIVSSYLYSPNNDALELLAGTSFSSSGAAISLRPSTGGYNDHGMEFYTGGGEKMRLDSNGYLLIGYTTSNSAYRLQVNSQIFATNATIATSDGRYKENISSIKSGLDVVGKLNPVSFTWKQHEIHNFDSGTQVGFIAQDVQEALADEPYLESIVKRNEVELKDGTKEEFYGLSDAKLIPILVKAIQELKAEIDILKARN